MKDPTFFIQSELYRMLHTNLVVDSNTVPVYSLEQPPSEDDGLYVNLVTSYIVPGKSKDKFRTAIRFQIDVINQLLGNELSTQKVENCCNQITEIVIPTTSTNGFLENADFGIIKCELFDTRYLNTRNETNYIVRKIIIFEILTRQK